MLEPLVLWRSSCSNSQYLIKTEEARKSLLFSCQVTPRPRNNTALPNPRPGGGCPTYHQFRNVGFLKPGFFLSALMSRDARPIAVQKIHPIGN
jgi:hypothetical protein